MPLPGLIIALIFIAGFNSWLAYLSTIFNDAGIGMHPWIAGAAIIVLTLTALALIIDYIFGEYVMRQYSGGTRY